VDTLMIKRCPKCGQPKEYRYRIWWTRTVTTTGCERALVAGDLDSYRAWRVAWWMFRAFNGMLLALNRVGVAKPKSLLILLQTLDTSIRSAATVGSAPRVDRAFFTAQLTRSSPKPLPVVIHSAPGWTLMKFARWIYTQKEFESIFEPTIVDFQMEYYAALADGDVLKAWYKRISGYGRFFHAAGLHKILSVAERIVRTWKLFG
jgi:hypothetical protein